ncbi:oxidoreductase [Xanthomonas vasicola]|uniref:SDR family NAD(P)-dependent oxidoreductase n=2 Tax=Xanthomonas vasicola TaxID=56459 RepID=A0ABD7SFW5_XANVA|nr:SDR family NAD(P)-dependent oxidoreductase [Xanthomonas vasicola]AZR23153.1 SDR family NAD(P)-dependent oxidoreductase [Xanthomonas vasicola]KGR43085.1 DltE [Xanthomonas vasicola]KGR43984.1 DltE [Xanthomonas vasicola]KGR60059.1 DltE [Xanthomonas vasicola]PPV03328.1 oxidoreductase [Xanthomonas vasicola]
MKASGNTILVTGGGSGIGRALAQRWHAAGNRVIVAGRRRTALEGTAAGHAGMQVRTLDIDDADAVQAFARELIEAFPNLNVLVNNAGTYASEDPRRQRGLADAERMLLTNVLGPIRLIDALIEHLRAQPDAALLNVSSGTAFVPYPAAPTYSASKAALHSYTAALRPLLQGRVEVIEIVPPQVQTELTPGQSQDPNSMPLDAFADEVMALLHPDPASARSPAEVCVSRVRPFRDAERNGQFNATLATIVAHLPAD